MRFKKAPGPARLARGRVPIELRLLAALHDRAHDCGQHSTGDAAAANRTRDLGDVESAAPTAEEAAQEATSESATYRAGDAVTSGAEVVLGACDIAADESTDDT